MYPNPPNHPTSNLTSHRNYQLLRQRGYTPQQIQGMLLHRQKTQQHQHQHQHPPSSSPPNNTNHTPHQTTHYTNNNRPLPAPPQQPSIDQSVMFSFQNVSNERRMQHTPQNTAYPDFVPPRANIQMQFKPDKSSIEGILQDAYERRQTDVFVPPARTNVVAPQTYTPHQHPVHHDNHNENRQHPTNTTTRATALRQKPQQQPSRHTLQQQRRKQFEAELNAMHNQKETAYELLGVAEGYSLRELAKNYRKRALKYHPDRLVKHAEYMTLAQKEKCEAMFEQITKSYLYLIEQHSLRESDKPFYELRDQSRSETEEQQQHTTNGTKVRLMDGDQFDVELFNKLYDENRLHEPKDDGYGDWLKAKPKEDTSDLFSNKFNLNVFNTTFNQLKHDNPHSQKQLAKRDEMGMMVQSDTTAFSTLGEGHIDDYGGATGDLHYSDLKDAHTTHATLIDTTQAQQQPQFRSVKEMEAHRSQISHTLSPAEAELQSFLKEKREHEELARRERLEKHDQLVSQQHQRIQQQLLQ